MPFVLRNDSDGWERVVSGVVLEPGTINAYGEVWTVEAIRQAAYMFSEMGFYVDIDHDNIPADAAGKLTILEFFLARPGDPDFIPGSLVVTTRINDDDLWQRILDGDITGYSYEAVISRVEAELDTDDTGERNGVTEPYVHDGHVHDFYLVIGDDNRPAFGGTTEYAGHSHTISSHSTTDMAGDPPHKHRINFFDGKEV